MKQLSFLFLIFSYSLQGQMLDDLQKDKNIEWIIETNFEYELENNDRVFFKDKKPDPKVLKRNYDNQLIKWDAFSAKCEFGPHKFFTNIIFENLEEGSIKAFSIDSPTRALSSAAITRQLGIVDTVTTFDPATYEEQLTVVRRSPIPVVKSLKIKQIWYYDQREKRMKNYVVDIIPLRWYENENGTISKQETFRVSNGKSPKAFDNINNPDFIWVRRTSNSFDLLNAKVLKGDFEKGFKKYIWEMPREKEIKAYSVQSSFHCSEELTTRELEFIGRISIDTVTTFDPETYEEQITIVRHPAIPYQKIVGHKVNQFWYYDRTTKSLNSKLVEIAPMFIRKNEIGDPLYHLSMYYLRQ